MSTLGQAGFGHWTLGHPPDVINVTVVTLALDTGAFVLSGGTMTFGFTCPLSTGAYALIGYSLGVAIVKPKKFKRFYTEEHCGAAYTTRVVPIEQP